VWDIMGVDITEFRMYMITNSRRRLTRCFWTFLSSPLHGYLVHKSLRNRVDSSELPLPTNATIAKAPLVLG
jgi:hypothetical protein